MASSCSLGISSTISCMAPSPLREHAVCPPQVREHRAFFTPNLRLNGLSTQASRRRAHKLMQQSLPPSDGRAPTLLMPAGEIEAHAATATPLTSPKVQGAPGRIALWACEPSLGPVLSAALTRHRLRAQPDVRDGAPGCLDHDARGNQGNPRERNVGC